MKSLKFILVLAVVTVGLTSCFKSNSAGTFTDADAYVAFDNPSLRPLVGSVYENAGNVILPVRLSSVSGVSGSVDVIIDLEASTGVAGQGFTDPGVITLNFTKQNPVLNYTLSILDNTVTNDDFTVVVVLTNAKGVKLGGDKTFIITVRDNEHPLMTLFGAYDATDYYDNTTGAAPYVYAADGGFIQIDPVAGNTEQVNITGLWGLNTDSGAMPIRGNVNLTAGTITISSGQQFLQLGATPCKIVSFDVVAGTYSETDPVVATIDSSSGMTINFPGWGVLADQGSGYVLGDAIERTVAIKR